MIKKLNKLHLVSKKKKKNRLQTTVFYLIGHRQHNNVVSIRLSRNVRIVFPRDYPILFVIL